jgi:hypothetical protein
MLMRWRVVKGCPELCELCRRDKHDCVRWYVVDDDCPSEDGIVALGFTCRKEAEAYVFYPEVRRGWRQA